MQFLISAGEASGDLHAANLIRALRSQNSDTQFIGFGGSAMAEAGCRLIAPLCDWSLMWFKAYRRYFELRRLIRTADGLFRSGRIDAVVLIDFPGFNWHLARCARRRGIPVFYFVPPQLWAWGAWRVRKMRRWVDHVLCALPFEYTWFARRGVNAQYIGHPYFDALAEHSVEQSFIEAQRAKPGRLIALLPGSRHVELEYNLSTILRAAKILRQKHADVRFLAAALNEQFRREIAAHPDAAALPLEICVGRTSEILKLSHAAIAVSGSVGLELLYHRVPSVITYRVHKLGWLLSRVLKKTPWISLVNLLANSTVFPEFLRHRCAAEEIAAEVDEWLADPAKASAVRDRLQQLCDSFAQPGACRRAAGLILDQLADDRTDASRVVFSGRCNSEIELRRNRVESLIADAGGQKQV